MKNKKSIIIFIILLLIIIFIIAFKDNILKIIYPKTYKEVVMIYEKKYNLDENLIFALIKAESNFDARSVSRK